MKKQFLFLVALIMSSTMVMAQLPLAAGKLIIEGEVSYDYTGVKTETEKRAGVTTEVIDGVASGRLNILPKVLYMLSDKLAVGAGLGYAGTFEANYDWTGQLKTTDVVHGLVLAPSARYYAFTFDKFAIFADATIPFMYGSVGKKYANINEGDQATDLQTQADKSSSSEMSIGLNMQPGVSYFPTESLSLNVKLNLGFLNYNYTKASMSQDDNSWSESNHKFGLGAKSELFSLSKVTVGVSFFF